MKRVAIVLLCMVIGFVWADFIEIGTGGELGPDFGPFYNYYENNRTQTLYLQSEMVGECLITQLSFNIAQMPEAGCETLTDFSIKLLPTTDAALTSGAFYDMTNATEVFFAASHQVASEIGWVDIDINDYAYDGQSNLIMDISWGDNNQWCFPFYRNFKTHTVGTTRMLFGYDDEQTPPAYLGCSDAFSNIRVHFVNTAGLPGPPTNPLPGNNSIDVALDADLTWDFGADTESYDLYFGTENPPTTLVVDNQPAAASGSYDPGTLAYQTDYYWQVISRNDNRAELAGSIWHFTTEFPPVDEGFETGDFTQHDWEFAGANDWMISNTEAHAGIYSAHGGNLGNFMTSSLSVEKDIGEAGFISFWSKTDMHFTDHLRFYIDDEVVQDWTNDHDWVLVSHPVDPGVHSFTWEYSTGIHSVQGCWIDDISFPPIAQYTNDLRGYAIEGPEMATAGTTAECTITVRNQGLAAQDAYTVKLFREGGDELASLNVTETIPAGEDAVHSLVWNIPEDELQDTTFVYGQVVLAGDENSANDQTDPADFIVLPAGTYLLLAEDFETSDVPYGWQTENVVGVEQWTFQEGGFDYHPPVAGNGEGNALLFHNDFDQIVTRLITPELNLGAANNGVLSFLHAQEAWSMEQDELRIYYKNTPASNWVLIAEFTENTPDWTERVVDLPEPSNSYYIAFEGLAMYGYGVCLDKVRIIGEPIIYETDLAAQMISGAFIANAGSSEPFEVTVKNTGTQMQDAYTVKLMRADDTELASMDITAPLQPDEEVIHTVVWNIPASQPVGDTSLYAKVVLDGDENIGNNCTCIHDLEIFPPGISYITVGQGTELNTRCPASYNYLNSLSETLYFPDELCNVQGSITDMRYFYDFDEDVVDRPLTIWMGETTQATLTNGWIPATELTEVYNGMLTYSASANHIDIPLDTPYQYNGANLVVMVQRPMDTAGFSDNNQFYLDETLYHADRTRYERDNVVTIDPDDPPVGYSFEKFPQVMFTFFMGEMGELEGTISDDQNQPLAEALVSIPELGLMTYADSVGYYHLGNITAGTYDITAEKFGYQGQTQNCEVVANQVVNLNFTLTSLGLFSVTGSVTGSDAPTVGLADASVSISGFASYTTTTDASGCFVVPDVYGNADYTISITADGYDEYTADFQVASADVDLGTCILNESTMPPGNISAAQNDAQTEVTLEWSAPGSGGAEFRYDDGTSVAHLGFSNTPTNGVFGSVHHYNAMIQEISWMLRSDFASHATVNLFVFGLDACGNPNQSDILLQQSAVLNVDNQWNSLVLDVPISAPNGFLVGVNTPGLYTSIALDDGADAPWEFIADTQMSIEDYTDASEDWVDIGDFGMARNMLIRAYGINLGPLSRQLRDAQKQISAMPLNRSFECYKIYRMLESNSGNPGQWDVVCDDAVDTLYTDLTWAQVPNGVYRYAITALHSNGVESLPAFSNTLEKTNAAAPGAVVPACTRLAGNYPNPFNPTTEICFSLRETSNVQLDVYNIRGEKVRTLVDGVLHAASHRVVWDGKDEQNRRTASGIYFYKMRAGKYTSTKKMILMK